MDTFENGKKYTFSKAKWLADEENALLYKKNPCLKWMVDSADGEIVGMITNCKRVHLMYNFITKPEYCEELKFNRHIVLGEDVKVTKSKGVNQ